MKIFITDGSAACFFTAVFDAYAEKDSIISSDKNIQLTFESQVVNVTPDALKNRRVQTTIDRCDKNAVDDVVFALRSCNTRKEQIAYDYIKKLLQIKKPVAKRLGVPEVFSFTETVRKIGGEVHMLKGLLRFTECLNGVLYAPYSPDNDITDLLMPHFAERFKREKFVIHDVKREVAGIYNGEEWITDNAGTAEIYLSQSEEQFKRLWKKYYDSVNIAERPHEKQMKGYMPARYWKFLPEKNGG